MPSFDFAILGAGALGTILGAHLAASGHQVGMLARGARAREIRAHGLRVRGLTTLALPVPVLEDPTDLEAAGVLIVTTKTSTTAAALAPLRGATLGIACSLQNGLMKNELLAAAFGRGCVLGATADASGELLPDGEVLFTRNAGIYLGELAASGPSRAPALATAFNSAGILAEAVPEIERYEWSKFAAWAGLMVLAVTVREDTWRFLVDPGSAQVLVRIVREIGVLARAHGIALLDLAALPVAAICAASPAEALLIVQRSGEQLRQRAPAHRMSTLQDLVAGRPLEIEETLGYAAHLATAAQQALPMLEACYPLIASIDRIRRAASAGAMPP